MAGSQNENKKRRLSRSELDALAARSEEVLSAQGHAEHFLSRLPRAEGEAGKLALALYHTPAALRFVLGWIKLPEKTERVALCLAPGDLGPYIVVEKNGKFVTCLGREMGIADLYLVGYDRLLALLKRWDEIAQSKEYILRLSSEDRLAKTWHRVSQAGVFYSQEDFDAVAPTQPALIDGIMMAMADNLKDMAEARWLLTQNRKHLDSIDDQALRDFYGMHHAVGHFLALLGCNGRRGLEHRLRDERTLAFIEASINLAWLSDSPGNLIRSVWFMGALGGFLDPLYEKWLRDPQLPWSFYTGLMGKILLLLRQKPRPSPGECEALAQTTVKILKGHDAAIRNEIYDFSSKDLWEIAMALPVMPERIHETRSLPSMKDAAWGALTLDGTQEHDVFKRAEDIPEQIAMAMPLMFAASAQRNVRDIETIMLMLPYLSRAPARDLYLPREFLETHFNPWERGDALAIIEHNRSTWTVTTQRNPSRHVGRNDPCPCGSGKKHKHCCLK